MKAKLFGWMLAGVFVSCTSNQNNAGEVQTLLPQEEVSVIEPKADVPAKVTVEWARNEWSGKTHDVALSENGSAQFAIMTDNVITDFKLLALTFVEANEMGEIKFSSEEKFALQNLSADERVRVQGTMFGTIPNIGISYVENGQKKDFAIVESGEDGSLSLMEIKGL
ncbi:MAG: hypothetical protein MJZ28_04100 [Paludibacteraceae bacterium]|nr:hypothetical protein [Paludibacteraceae bacterium]